MGHSSWSAAGYSTTSSKIASGTSFGYHRAAMSSGRVTAHETLDPKHLNKAGLLIREARDSADHPNSVPIVVGFDATGSMGAVPRIVQEKLAGLFGLLTTKGYVEDPQICISAYGDSYCDRVPLQISQFESDNTVDDNLDNLLLEGGGGGNGGETATLLWYYLAHQTATDAWEKRGKKGYVFLIADERALDLKPDHIKQFIGVDEVKGDITAAGLAKELTKKWDVYVLLIDNTSAKFQGSERQYTDLFGRDHVLIIEEPTTISETIGAALGRLENDEIDEDDIINDMVALGTNKADATAAAKAVARLGASGGGTVAKGNANLNLDDEDDAPILL